MPREVVRRILLRIRGLIDKLLGEDPVETVLEIVHQGEAMLEEADGRLWTEIQELRTQINALRDDVDNLRWRLDDLEREVESSGRRGLLWR